MMPQPDIELNTLKMKEESITHGSSLSMREPQYDDGSIPRRWERFIDSFKRDTRSSLFLLDHIGNMRSDSGRLHNGGHYYDLHLANLETANSGLARKLKGRHLQMIAIGGSIGTSA